MFGSQIFNVGFRVRIHFKPPMIMGLAIYKLSQHFSVLLCLSKSCRQHLLGVQEGVPTPQLSICIVA